MKATMLFDLDDPDDALAHMRCVKALDMALALYDIQRLMGGCEDNETNEVWCKKIQAVFDEYNIVPGELTR